MAKEKMVKEEEEKEEKEVIKEEGMEEETGHKIKFIKILGLLDIIIY